MALYFSTFFWWSALLIGSVYCESNNVTMLEDKCPIWSKSASDCQCASDLRNVVLCSRESLRVQACYCLYYDEELDRAVVGYCIITCNLHHYKLYYTIPRISNRTVINEQMCSGGALGIGNKTHLHRSGRLCGKCEPGYGLPAYSYHFNRCIKCSAPSYKSWIWYFAIALGPLTIFYFIVMIFEINAASSRLNMYVFCCQILSMPVQLRLSTSALEYTGIAYKWEQKFAYFIISIFGIWNLDFFRAFYNPFCIHPEMNVLQIITMDYIVAFYPVTLTLITYTLVWMHNHNFRIVAFLWKPFYLCLTRFRRHWNIQTSLIKVFATFLLLSYVKLLGVSFDLLVPTRLFNSAGSAGNGSYLYYDASIEMFGPDHLPYAIVAIVILALFIFCPLLLFCLYPCRWFQRLLNLTGLRCQALHTFMDVYTGLYRHEPHDWRYFAAFHVLARIISLVVFEFVLSLYVVLIISLMGVFGAALTVVIQPNKSASHNALDVAGLLGLATGYGVYAAVIFSNYVSADHWVSFIIEEIAFFILFVPLLYPLAFFCKYLYKKFNIKQVCLAKCNSLLPNIVRRHDSTESLPDRMMNEEDYPPLLPRRNLGQIPSHSTENIQDTY